MRFHKCEVLAIVFLFTSLFLAAVPLAEAQATTEFSGLITTNMTWTKQLSPFVFTGPVTIVNGVTLTIQPGVSVVLSSTFTLTVNGTLLARGNSTDPIRFTGGSTSGFGPVIFTTFSAGWNEQTSTGCIIENAIFSASGIDVENSSPKINNCTLNNSEIVINAASRGSPIISNNTIRGTGILSSFGITCGGNAVITGNNISGLQTGIDIYLGNATVTNNIIWNNSQITSGGEGIRIEYRSDFGLITSPVLSNNTVVYNNIGITLAGSPTPKIFYNNINNNTNYNINLDNFTIAYFPKGGAINATYNYWGTTNATLVNRTIWDFKNDFTLGNVTYVPFLNSSNSAAPPVPVPGIFIPEFLESPALLTLVFLTTFGAITAGSFLLKGRRTKFLRNPL